MALISLFVGMYIRKVEVAFESMGQRFGDMLSGILGVSMDKLNPQQQDSRRKELKDRFFGLADRLDKLSASPVAAESMGEAMACRERARKLYLDNRLEALDMELFDLEIQVRRIEKGEG